MAATSTGVAVLLAGGLAAVHAVAGRLRFLTSIPRSQYLSLAGSVSVAYVFAHLLPEVTARQAELAAAAESPLPGVFAGEQALFTVALAGFAVFYALEQLAARSRRRSGPGAVAGGATTPTSERVFWLHIGSFAVYNVLVGYFLFHREATGTVALLLYFVAMALHFVVNDHGLRERHRAAYSRIGRWVLVASIGCGALVGVLVAVSTTVLGLLLAFLAGGVILNVIKEELPEERESSVPAFAVGLVGYTAILLSV
ncbi:hypothetical protein [Haloarcula onubensis]|uniref:ZIP Zinc transporter n=1 Tax=Haloarcula onubensis TaxID=2950539 RepID=A0ABU2FN65_9EURY|nr:hypothetical protein [Halomicroarcula sp. S3CR25-11]MDS0282205.1 hypothetical protein [Halomicroarcula sp. S3CR25-11]